MIPLFGRVARACREEIRRASESTSADLLAFTVPVRTRSEQNMRESWMAKASRVKAQRAATSYVMRGLRTQVEEVRQWQGWTIVLTRIGRAELDEGDNLNGSMKAIRDQVALELGCAKLTKRGKLVSNDSDPRLQFHYAQNAAYANGYAVHVRIERRAA